MLTLHISTVLTRLHKLCTGAFSEHRIDSAYNPLCPKMYLCNPLRTASFKLETRELCISGTIRIRCQCIWIIKMYWSHTRNTSNAKQNRKASLFMRDWLAELDLLQYPIGSRKTLVPPWRKQRLYFSTAVQNWKRLGFGCLHNL